MGGNVAESNELRTLVATRVEQHYGGYPCRRRDHDALAGCSSDMTEWTPVKKYGAVTIDDSGPLQIRATIGCRREPLAQNDSFGAAVPEGAPSAPRPPTPGE